MTPKISLVTVVAVALVAVPAAWGKGEAPTASPDVFERAAAAHQRSTTIVSPDVVDRALAAKLAQQSTPIVSPDAVDRAVAAKLASQLVPQPSPRAMLASDSVESAITAREPIASEPSNLRDVLASDSVDSARVANAATLTSPDPVTSNSSGRELEWPQIGIGFGLGIVLALGLFLAMRYTRIRPLAH